MEVRGLILPQLEYYDMSPFHQHDDNLQLVKMTIQIIATIISSLITGFILTRFGYRLGVSDNKIIGE